MSNTPNPPSNNDNDGDAGNNPDFENMFQQLFGNAAGQNPFEAFQAHGGFGSNTEFMSMFNGLQQLLNSPSDQGLDKKVIQDIAQQTLNNRQDDSDASSDATALPNLDLVSEEKSIRESFTIATQWLNEHTHIPENSELPRAWSRQTWIRETLPAWIDLATPVSESVTAALINVLKEQIGATPFAGFDPTTIFGKLGKAVFGMQLGNATGNLAKEVFGSTDIGFPLLREPSSTLIPENVYAFAKDLGIPIEEVRIFLALRESAHNRLFSHTPWLRPHILNLIENYSNGIEIDTRALEDSVSSIDPTDTEALQIALSSGVFKPQSTPEQQQTLLRLETFLALIEGWVDEVTATAAEGRLKHTSALQEMLRRRRAAGGPAEAAFAELVGLELRPRRSREAAKLWETIVERKGSEERDRLWDHIDLLPKASDLDTPENYFDRVTKEQTNNEGLDAFLADLLGSEPNEDEK